MDLEIKPQELRDNVRLFIATPMYGGYNHGLFLKSALDLQATMFQYGIEHKFSFLFNESLVQRARNYLADEFLQSTGRDGKPYTHLLFIDADIHYNPIDILAMLTLDKDIVAGPYPKKSINWKNIWLACKKLLANPQFDEAKFQPSMLETMVGEYVFNMVPGTKRFSTKEPVEVMETGTGFMMIKREVLETYAREYPHFSYKPDHKGGSFDGHRNIHAFFHCDIDPNSGRYLSEDYLFCQNWRAIGGKIWVCPWINLQHIGTYGFNGNLQMISNLTGEL
jgi:hypothetical protein